MTPGGYLALVLHAHLPFVHELDQEDSLEQRWLFEAITESYIPLLLVLDKLAADGIDFRLTLSITPTLASMLADPLLQSRYLAALERLMELSEKEVVRTRSDPQFGPLAQMYRGLFAKIHDAFVRRYKKNLLDAFHRHQMRGSLEILASAATHAYLPLLAVQPASVRAQIRLGVDHYREVFGRAPAGFWLPECGYYPGLDSLLDEEGVRFTILETHGITRADHRPHYGVHAPIYCPSGVAAFGRDPECSRQVWSASEGYPGDFDYREYYRDIGYDLDREYIRPYIHADGTRRNTGIKYYRITGHGDRKEPYVPEWAGRKTEVHAEHFLSERRKQIERLGKLMDRTPLVVAPYDAELFGHWWFEGPRWLDQFIRKVAQQDTIRLITLSEYLQSYPTNQVATPSMSSWGLGGFNEVWLNGRNDWIYPLVHRASAMMEDLASHPVPSSKLETRALNQAARELLLAQASDWAFMINAGTMVDYATRRVKGHLERFHQLREQIQNAAIDEESVITAENEDNIFGGVETAAAFRTQGLPSRTIVEAPGVQTLDQAQGLEKTKPGAPFHVVMVCPEILPFAKTGGLADMTAALALALEELGHRVSLIMPAYRRVFDAGIPLDESGIRLEVPIDGRRETAGVLRARIGSAIDVYFIRADRYFGRDQLYGTPEGDYWDNAERFAFFSRAALELLGEIGHPDVLHVHDWPAALAIVFLKTQPERYPSLAAVPTVLTVHNLGYQGVFSANDWRFLDLDPGYFNSEWLEFYGRINFLKAGLVFADAITTVSPTYACEIRSAEYGFGLEGILQKRARDTVGILNGADYAVWDPEIDPFLARNFSRDEVSGKQACKDDLQTIFGLQRDPNAPLIAVISRLAEQKGLDLVQGILGRLLQTDVQFVLLGAGDRRYQDSFQAEAFRHPGRIGVKIGFDEVLAHKIEAGADIFLMPSRYEPGGLNQLYSLKYGTIPVVRSTGGLKDSVKEFHADSGEGTGFLFEAYNSDALLEATHRALTVFRSKEDWAVLMKNAMTRDYSWTRSAFEYAALYRRMTAERRQVR
jgi:1,4-alpha-glucan branching enzyme